jgi:regulator of protease activity HflC (stomatin/prohibitin superfamily)
MHYDIIIAVVPALAIVIAWRRVPKFRHCFRVPEGQAGLLYRDGLYVRRNNAGRSLVWGFGWTMNLIDLRKASLVVAGQEVLTADNLSLESSLLVTYQVTEPARAAHETQHWPAELGNSARLALRAVAAGMTLEALLRERLEIGAQLLARVQPEAAKIGVSVLAVELKDVTLPRELRRAFASMLEEKQEILAAENFGSLPMLVASGFAPLRNRKTCGPASAFGQVTDVFGAAT